MVFFLIYIDTYFDYYFGCYKPYFFIHMVALYNKRNRYYFRVEYEVYWRPATRYGREHREHGSKRY